MTRFCDVRTRQLTNRTSIGYLLTIGLGLCLVAQAGLMEDLAAPIQGRSRRASSTFRPGPGGKHDRNAAPLGDLTERSNSDNQSVPPGGTNVLLDVKGPGVVTHIWATFLGPEPQDWAPAGSADHQEMLVRMYWDGESRPSVEAPLGDFFACAFGLRREVISTPVVVEDADSYNCFWRMPFRKAARIEVVNQSKKSISLFYFNIDWIELPKLARDTPYFHAQYRQEYPAKHGVDYTVLDTQGKGHYVGTVLSVRTRSPAWFGEGDEKIYVDGESKPSIWGTGTEDYFLSAWGLKTTSTPYAGVPVFDQWGIVGGHTSAYRWHLLDPIVFNTGLKVTFEHFGWIAPDENPEGKSTSWNEREDDYSSVAFWYQTGPSTFADRAPSAEERRLPSLERQIVMAKEFASQNHHGTGPVTTQRLELYPEAQLLYQPADATNAWLEFTFEVRKKEPLRLLINATTSYDFGIYQASLNGVKLGDPMDFYSAKIANQEFHLLDFWPTPGSYTLRLECLGKNPAAQGHFAGIESIRLRERRPRVEQYGKERDSDWKEKKALYR